MAKSHKAKVEAARRKRDDASDAVYAQAQHPSHTFGKVMEYCAEKARKAYVEADAALLRAELDAVDAGKAWRGTFGTLLWYR